MLAIILFKIQLIAVIPLALGHVCPDETTQRLRQVLAETRKRISEQDLRWLEVLKENANELGWMPIIDESKQAVFERSIQWFYHSSSNVLLKLQLVKQYPHLLSDSQQALHNQLRKPLMARAEELLSGPLKKRTYNALAVQEFSAVVWKLAELGTEVEKRALHLLVGRTTDLLQGDHYRVTQHMSHVLQEYHRARAALQAPDWSQIAKASLILKGFLDRRSIDFDKLSKRLSLLPPLLDDHGYAFLIESFLKKADEGSDQKQWLDLCFEVSSMARRADVSPASFKPATVDALLSRLRHKLSLNTRQLHPDNKQISSALFSRNELIFFLQHAGPAEVRQLKEYLSALENLNHTSDAVADAIDEVRTILDGIDERENQQRQR